MTDWKSYKSQTPFQFVVAPSESYNEGNKIAFSPKIPGKSPVWSMNMSGVAITPTHTPCRYWTGEGWEWKTWTERICMGLEISYTKTTMDLNEQQVLRVKDLNGDIVDVDIVVWFLTGVGSINAEIGSSITYTAPSENVTESDTATIEMWCNGEVKDTLVINIPYKCTETNTSIGYTSAQMSVSQQQTLQLLGSSECESQCVWSVDHGTLSASSGTIVTYTAPSTNANCENNATVTVTCNGVVVDTFQIAINAVTSLYAAYAIKTCVEPHCISIGNEGCTGAGGSDGCARCANIVGHSYNCDGTLRTTPSCSTGPLKNYVDSCANAIGIELSGQDTSVFTYYREGRPAYIGHGLYADVYAAYNAAATWPNHGQLGGILTTWYGARGIYCTTPPYYNTEVHQFWYPYSNCGDISSCAQADAKCTTLPPGFGTLDMRTAANKAAGCCPASLL